MARIYYTMDADFWNGRGIVCHARFTLIPFEFVVV
jgi:hypothetical protein